MSTGPQITFENDVYIEGQVSVSTFKWDEAGRQNGSIRLSNEGNSASALILNSTTNDIGIEIYATYLIAGGGNTDPQLYVRGVMDGGDIQPNEAIVNVVSTTSQTAFLPNRYHTIDEGFNYLPIEGEVIIWGEEVFELRSI
jgi:hypothetical protein